MPFMGRDIRSRRRRWVGKFKVCYFVAIRADGSLWRSEMRVLYVKCCCRCSEELW